jgi:tRNA isopentenyl-2-thiomethyl-A-37 hydroxylase MiaE
VLVDPPRWPAHGRLWSHLVSDASHEELHHFAARLGIPHRAFDRDHYDIPQERYAEVVAAGASEVEGKELIRRLIASGLRVRKRDVPH